MGRKKVKAESLDFLLLPFRPGMAERNEGWEAGLRKGRFPKNIFSHVILFLFIVWLGKRPLEMKQWAPQCLALRGV